MGKVGTSYLLTQLGYQAPALLVYLVAFVLALIYMRRASMPSILTLVGVGILVVTTLGIAVMQASLFDSRQAYGGDSERIPSSRGTSGWLGAMFGLSAFFSSLSQFSLTDARRSATGPNQDIGEGRRLTHDGREESPSGLRACLDVVGDVCPGERGSSVRAGHLLSGRLFLGLAIVGPTGSWSGGSGR